MTLEAVLIGRALSPGAEFIRLHSVVVGLLGRRVPENLVMCLSMDGRTTILTWRLLGFFVYGDLLLAPLVWRTASFLDGQDGAGGQSDEGSPLVRQERNLRADSVDFSLLV